MRNPQHRGEVIRPVIEGWGGCLERPSVAFGEYDMVVIVEMPTHVSMAAVALAVAAGGVLKAMITIPLLTMKEGLEALRKASGTG